MYALLFLSNNKNKNLHVFWEHVPLFRTALSLRNEITFERFLLYFSFLFFNNEDSGLTRSLDNRNILCEDPEAVVLVVSSLQHIPCYGDI